MNQKTNGKTNIVGEGEIGCAMEIDMEKEAVHKTNRLFWGEKGGDRAPSPSMGPLFPKKNAGSLAMYPARGCWR